tara:strand:+ start:811 stop:1326 length:516 start_codon:yes stop_codon:yes gene_type:complete
MGDKNIVLRDLRISYNGPIDLNEFNSEIDNWLRKNGFDKESKKYGEHLLKSGKKVEIIIEGHKDLDKWHAGTIRLKALFTDLKDKTLKINDKKMRISYGDVLVYIDCIIDSRLKESIYHNKPIYQIVIQLIDKFIYNFWTDKHNDEIGSMGQSFYKQIRSFFSLQKYKFQE